MNLADQWAQALHALKIATLWAATGQNQQNECAPSEDSVQPGRPPSLIRVFAVRMEKHWVLSYSISGQRRLWSDWADQADLSLCWAHTHFVGFVMSRLIWLWHCLYGDLILELMMQITWNVSKSLSTYYQNLKSSMQIWRLTVNFLNIRTPKKFVVITLKNLNYVALP